MVVNKSLVDLEINIANKSNKNAAQSGKKSLEYMNYISDMSITDTVYSLKFLLQQQQQ
jgi:FlaG/FlaF family flagellin (archaellin)